VRAPAVAGGLPALARAQPAPFDVVWYAAEITTGQVLTELPLSPSPISRVIGQAMSTSLDVVLADAPLEWEASTEPGYTMVVCVLNGVPIWPGLVIGRTRGTAPTATLSVVTPEAYLDRRYTSDHTWTGADECSVVGSGLIGDCAINGIGLAVDAPPDGTLIDALYADSDDTSILSALQTLMETGSPEFTIDVDWADSTMTGFVLTVRLRSQLGVQSTTPAAVFELPGPVTSYEQAESYASGSAGGADVVRAYGDGEGVSRASSGDVAATALLASGWPRWDYRWTPNQATTDPAVLQAAAAQAIALMSAGTSLWTITAAAALAPQLGTDWSLGDSIGLLVAPATAPGHPRGVAVVLRALGWSLDVAGHSVSPVMSGGS
jgi:hypothetical protein